MKKSIIKTTALVASLLWFSGCEDTCCTDGLSKSENINKTGTEKSVTYKTIPLERPVKNIGENGIATIKPISILSTAPIVLKPDAVANDKGKGNPNSDVIKATHCEYVEFTEATDSNYSNYKWINFDGSTLSEDKEFAHRFKENGLYEVTLTVTDKNKNVGSDKLCLLVGLDDKPLVAYAGADQVIEKDTSTTLTGRLVCNDKNVTYSWTENCKVVSTEKTFTTDPLSEGKHKFKLTIEDDAGHKTYDKVVVKVK